MKNKRILRKQLMMISKTFTKVRFLRVVSLYYHQKELEEIQIRKLQAI